MHLGLLFTRWPESGRPRKWALFPNDGSAGAGDTAATSPVTSPILAALCMIMTLNRNGAPAEAEADGDTDKESPT
jgi:hypothetical protein